MKGVLVSGGAKRIGSAICQHLAAQGWHTLVHYFRSADEAALVVARIRQAGGAADSIQADLRDADAPAHLLAGARALCPGLAALVNNASEFDYDDAGTVTARRLEEKFATNASAPIMLCTHFARTQTGSGSIVNILDNRVFAPNPDYFSYSVSKFALWGATQMLAQALAPRIRVNGVAPGIALLSGAQSAENFEVAKRLNPLGVNCTPDQIARAVQFLLGSASSNGSIITIDGGETLAPHGRDVAFVAPERP